MQESTAPSKGDAGYGYFWWLMGDGAFRAVGIFGQAIYVNREANVVIAMHSAWPVAVDASYRERRDALFAAITDAVKD